MVASRSRPVRIPKLSRHRKSNQAYVTWQKKRRYMEVWGKQETEERYRRFVADLVSQPEIDEPVRPTSRGRELQIVELCAAFWKHAEKWYVKDGNPTLPSQLAAPGSAAGVHVSDCVELPLKLDVGHGNRWPADRQVLAECSRQRFDCLGQLGRIWKR